MTLEEKKALAEQLARTRPGGNAPFVIPDSYQPYYASTTVEKRILQTSAGDTPVWLVESMDRQRPSAVFVNIHGGGFIGPHSERDEAFCRRIACEVGILVVDISYRLAHEAGFPIACHESYDCVKWVADHAASLGVDRDKIIVGGHSAGGNLTAGICMQAKEKKEFSVAMQILDYPPLDLLTDPEEKPDSDKTLIPPERARSFNLLYVENEENAGNVLASPVLAAPEMLEGLPEALIYTAGADNLRFEAERYALKLIEAGVPVKVQRFLHSGHGFVIACAGQYEEAIAGIEEAICTVISRKIKMCGYQSCDANQTLCGVE